jgi:hypothetical protein
MCPVTSPFADFLSSKPKAQDTTAPSSISPTGDEKSSVLLNQHWSGSIIFVKIGVRGYYIESLTLESAR